MNFFLPFCLREIIPSDGETHQLVNWLLPEQTNDRCENPLSRGNEHLAGGVVANQHTLSEKWTKQMN